MVLEYYSTLVIILKIGTSISIITTILDIALYWLFPQNRSFSFSNIIILAFINLLYSIFTLIPAEITLKQPENTTSCEVQSFLVNFFHCAQYLQISIISYCLFIKLLTKNHLERHPKLYRGLFIMLLLMFPLVFSVYIVLTKAYGGSFVFCWINIYSLYKKDHIRRVVLNYYIAIWFLLFMNIFFIVKVKVMMKKNKIKNEIYNHLMKYPIIMFAFTIPGTFNMIYHIEFNHKDIPFMVFLQVICECCFGTVINIYFITSPWIKQCIINFIRNRKKGESDDLLPRRDTNFCYDDNDEKIN